MRKTQYIYIIYDATKAGPIREKEWPKYQKIFLSDQAVRTIPFTQVAFGYILGMDTINYNDLDHRCPVQKSEIKFQAGLQKLVDKRSLITVFTPYYLREGHEEQLIRYIVLSWINGECKIIGYADTIGLPHSE